MTFSSLEVEEEVICMRGPNNGTFRLLHRRGSTVVFVCATTVRFPTWQRTGVRLLQQIPAVQAYQNITAAQLKLHFTGKEQTHSPGISYKYANSDCKYIPISSGCPAVNNDVDNCLTGTSGYLRWNKGSDWLIWPLSVRNVFGKIRRMNIPLTFMH